MADLDAQDAGRRAALDGESPEACEYRGEGTDVQREQWARGFAEGRTEVRRAQA